MVKVHKDICIDDDLCKKLRNLNASETINKLLRDFFNEKPMENISELRVKETKIKQILKENRKELRIISSKIASFVQKEKSVLKIFDELTGEQRNILKGFDSEPSLLQCSFLLKKDFKGFTITKLKQLWRSYNGII